MADQWQITYSGRECIADEVAYLTGDTPLLYLKSGGKEFQVQFLNRSDYMAGRDSSVSVEVKVINSARTKYWDGAAVRLIN